MALTAALCHAEPEAPDPDPGDPDKRETMFSLIVKGGPVMIPIGLASVVALALTVERFLSLKRDNVIPPDFLDGLATAWSTGGNDPANAIRYCEETSGAVGHIFKAALQRIHKGEDAIEKAIEDAGYREADKMKRSLEGLSLVASTTPLLGLLGTVYGMINAFQTATIKGMEAGGGADHLAKGIYEALVTTAAGLTVAIPVLFLYRVLSAKVDGLIDDLDEMGLEFLTSYIDAPPAAAAAVPQASLQEPRSMQGTTQELPKDVRDADHATRIPPVQAPETRQ
jgi:biopolymer transport protein ExbB